VSWGGPKWSAVYRYNCTCIGTSVCVLCSQIKTITHWHLICSRRAQQCIHENSVKALSDEHKTTTAVLSHGDSDYRIRGSVTGGPGGLGLPRDLAPGAGAQWGNLVIAHVGAQADRGDADRRVRAEEATEPHSQRNATAARSKTQSPARTMVNHAQRLGKSMSGCGQFSRCCKTKQAPAGLRLQPRGL
jgi:hypothetical protein